MIVGNGMVSRRLCETLLQMGAGEVLPEIVVFGEESRPAYDRVHLGDVLRGRPAESLLLSAPAWYESQGIVLHLGDQVEHIDRQAQLLVSRRGQRLRYDRLVLATGAAPICPPVIADRGDLHFLRTLDDVERLRDCCQPGKTAVVIGGGLLGVETAAALCETGMKVTLVEVGEHLMRRQLDASMARALAAHLTERGLQVVTGHALSTVVRHQGRKRVILAGGLELDADLVVVATGVRPRDELGGTELLRHAQGGYVVDEYMATQDPRVFAIGDCAVVLGRPAGTVLPGYEMADALAATLLGRARAFRPPAPGFRLKLPGTPLLLVGRCPEEGWSAVHSGKRGQRALFVEGGRLQAAASLGAWAEWNRIEQAVVSRAPVTDVELKRFAREGELPLGPPVYRSLPTLGHTPIPAGRTPMPDVTISAGDIIVCSCNLVSACALQSAITKGCRNIDDLMARTRAGSSCGSCLPAVQAVLAGQETSPLVRPMRSLALTGMVALLLAVLLPLARLPIVRQLFPTVEAWDFLGRDPWTQQLTGFGVLGLFALALLLPLRRYLGDRLPGRVNLWRVIHAGVGVGLCAGLIVHSSARLGQGLNLGLSLTVLLLVVAGAALAMVWRRAPPQTSLAMRHLRPLHLWILWPALGLLLVHILAVYYF